MGPGSSVLWHLPQTHQAETVNSVAQDTLFYWGILVTSFLFFAALLVAREHFEEYVDEHEPDSESVGEAADQQTRVERGQP